MESDILQNPDYVREASFAPTPLFFGATQTPGGITVATINGLGGDVIVSGGTTGLNFTPAAPNVTLSGTLAVANGGTGSATAGGALTNLGVDTIATKKSNLGAGADPLATDDSGSGYAIGSVWTTTTKAFIALDVSVGAAVWLQIG